jgi:hypothetical protein
MKIANMLSIALVTGTAAVATLSFSSLGASATPVRGVAIVQAAQQVDAVISIRKRCPNGLVRDRHGYCIPSAQGF